MTLIFLGIAYDFIRVVNDENLFKLNMIFIIDAPYILLQLGSIDILSYTFLLLYYDD